MDTRGTLVSPNPPNTWHERRSIVIVPLVTAIVVAIAGMGVAWMAADRVLRDFAREEAAQWAAYIERNFASLDRVIAGDPISEQDEVVLALARDAGDVFRYKIFDPEGRIMFTSDFLESEQSWQELAGKETQELDPALYAGEMVIEIEDGREKPDRPDSYAEAYLPLVDDSGMRGVVEVYVDMTATFERHWRTMGFAIAAIAALLAVAAILPGAFMLRLYGRICRAEEHNRTLAYKDPLTGLANRTSLQESMAEVTEEARDSRRSGALMVLDLDHFKSINDTFGHHTGDALLKVAAERISSCVGAKDVVARLGGDEFAVIVVDADNVETVRRQAQRINTEIREIAAIEGRSLSTGASIGIAIFPDHGTTPDLLLRNADLALYRAKEAGRGTYSFFENSMLERVEAEHRLSEELHRSLVENDFELHYQPVVRLTDGRIIGAEGLLRWHHPETGTQTAETFLSALSDSQLMGSLSSLGTELAIAGLKEIRMRGNPDFKLSINLSGAQLRRPDLVRSFEELITKHGVPPGNLILEITENVVFGRDMERIGDALYRLRDLGLRISLDDFGTGSASLAHLKRLPISQIKIDSSFVRDIVFDRDDEMIVRSIIALCASMNLELVAEGVEDSTQLSCLVGQGCRYGQGYILGEPMPLEDLLARLENTDPNPEKATPIASTVE